MNQSKLSFIETEYLKQLLVLNSDMHSRSTRNDWHFWHQDTIVRPKVAEASQFEPANAGTVYHLKFDRPLLLIV